MGNCDEPIADLRSPSVYKAENDRLLRITGFVTTLTEEGDTRALAFARYYHVRRVVWTSRQIAWSYGAVSLETVNDLAWSHDLNRWPFAHNSEKGRFDQAADLPRYFEAKGIDVASCTLIDLQGIIDKNPATLSVEGRVVLLADMLTGFIEDPLWMTTALDLKPDFIPPAVSAYLGLDLSGADLPAVAKCASCFRRADTHEFFVREFDEMFVRCMGRFINNRRPSPHDLESADFAAKRHLVKEKFLRKVVFPYNNERVSRGSLLRRVLVEPLLEGLGDSANAMLTTWDEPQAVEHAVERGLLDESRLSTLLPRLDYVTTQEPNNSFSRTAGWHEGA